MKIITKIISKLAIKITEKKEKGVITDNSYINGYLDALKDFSEEYTIKRITGFKEE